MKNMFSANSKSDWTERDYFMEKFGLDPHLSHYYRDTRGDSKYWLDIMLPHSITDVLEYALKEVGCGVCKAGTWTIRSFFGSAPVEFLFNEIGIMACELLIPTLAGYKRNNCPGIIRQQWTGAIFPILTTQLFDEKLMCVFNLNLCQSLDYNPRSLRQDVFDILQTKSEVAKQNDFINKLYDQNRNDFSKPGRETIKIAMMSDLHIDYQYTIGNDNDCGKPLCCRVDSGLAPTKERAAGKWGDYRCDLNEITMKNMLEFINDEI